LATIYQVEKALLAADAAGETEDAKVLAKHLRGLREADQTKSVFDTLVDEFSDPVVGVPLPLPIPKSAVPEKETILEGMAGINRGSVALLNIPPMLFNAFSGLFGSDARASMFTDLPIIKEATEGGFMEEGAGRSAVRIGSEFLGGGFTPTTIVQKIAAQLPKKVATTTAKMPVGTKVPRRTYLETAAADPTKFLKQETITSGLFAAGGAAGSYVSDGDPLAELVGGFFAATRGSAVKLPYDAAKFSGTAIKEVFSNQAAKKRAVNIIKTHASNPDLAIKNLNASLKAGKQGTLSQMTDDVGIAGLENELINASQDTFKVALRESDNLVNNTLIEEFKNVAQKPGDSVFRRHLQSKVRESNNSVNNIVQSGIKDARSKFETLGTPLEVPDASIAFSKEINNARTKIEALESQAWSKVPKDFTVSTVDLKKSLKSLFNEKYSKTEATNATRKIKNELSLLRKLDKKVTPRELASLRSIVLSKKREFVTKDPVTRVLDDIQSQIIKKLESVDGGVAYKQATAISKRKHELFTQGPLGKPINKLSEEELGAAFIRSGGVGGPIADDVIKITKELNIDLNKASEDMITASFFKTVTNQDGTVSVNAAARFISKYENMLNRFPNLKEKLTNAKNAQSVAADMQKRGEVKLRAIEKSRSKIYSDFDDPISAVNNALSSKDKQKSFRYLVKMANRDPDGMAIKGLKRDVIDNLLSKITSETVAGQKVLKQSFRNQLSQNKNAYKEVFSRKELDEISRLSDSLDSFFIRTRVPASKTSAQEDLISMAVGQYIGARLGAQVGASPLIAAGWGRKAATNILSKMPRVKSTQALEEMILNPAEFKKFSEEFTRSVNEEQAINSLKSWLISAGVYSTNELNKGQE